MAKRLEQLTADILDDEFVNIFEPIHKVQLIYGCLHVQIKDGFITTPSKSMDVYNVIVWSLNLFMHYWHINYCNYTTSYPTILTTLHYKLSYHVLFFPELLMVLYERFFIDQKRNLQMYVRLQKIDRYLDVEDRKKKNRFIARLSVTSICLCVFFTIAGTATYNIALVDKYFCFPLLFCAWGPTAGFTYGTLIIIIMYYLSVKVEFLITKLNSHLQNSNSTIYHIQSSLKERKDTLNTKTWDKLVTSVHLIVMVISDFLYLYQHKIFYMHVQTTIWTLIFVERGIQNLKKQISIDNVLSLCLIAILVMFLVMMLISCLMASHLSSKLDNLRKVSIQIVNSTDNKITRRYMKSILLLLEVRNSISIYDVYVLDSTLFIKLLALVASYTVALCYSFIVKN